MEIDLISLFKKSPEGDYSVPGARLCLQPVCCWLAYVLAISDVRLAWRTFRFWALPRSKKKVRRYRTEGQNQQGNGNSSNGLSEP